jgi:hypothetical protein
VVKKGGGKSKGGKGKKGGKGGRGGGADKDDEEPARRVTYRPCDSFFRFFLAEEGSSSGGGGRGAAGFDPTLPSGLDGGSDDEVSGAQGQGLTGKRLLSKPRAAAKT